VSKLDQSPEIENFTLGQADCDDSSINQRHFCCCLSEIVFGFLPCF
jgi:hypothetical protein